MSDLIPSLDLEPHPIATLQDAEHALATIAVAEAAEPLWARAKDATRLYAAIKAKLVSQAHYAVWRQTVAVQGRHIVERRYEQLPAADPGKDVIARWRERLCDKDDDRRWHIDEAKLAIALADAAKRTVRICEQENMGTVRGTEGTGEFERYTPAPYIAAARQVLGTIDLDPASSDHAQQTVGASQHFTAEDDGLSRDWTGNVWLNPPYHRELAPQFIAKLIAELAAGHVASAIVLTNNSTDTEWFRNAASVCNAVCFTHGRIHFEVPNAAPVMPTQGQAFFYFGADVDRFVWEFAAIGFCMQPIKSRGK